jgi:hypothetical protein
MPLADVCAVALHGVDGVLVKIEAHTHLTAVVTATSSTVPHSNTTQRTPHGHVAWFDQGPACIC